jgi:hypothetical protein
MIFLKNRSIFQRPFRMTAAIPFRRASGSAPLLKGTAINIPLLLTVNEVVKTFSLGSSLALHPANTLYFEHRRITFM